MVQTIGKYYDAYQGAYVVGPIDVTYGNNTPGTGNISVFTTNSTVIGNSTIFTTQLGNGFVLRNSANVYIGKISNIISNTSATLTSNANVAVANLGFNFQTYSYTVLNFDTTTWRRTDYPFVGNGTINVSTTSSQIIGTQTAFLKQLTVGTQIFDNVNYISGNLIGVVKSVYSNTIANLVTFATTNANVITYNFYDAYPNVAVPPFKSNIFNPKADAINSALLHFSSSGLLQNKRQIKSFHPPVPDPVSGILVNFPASVIETKSIGNLVTLNYSDQHLFNLPNNQHNSNVHVVKDFDAENAIVGSSTRKAIESIPINRIISKLKDKSSDDKFSSDVKDVIDTIYGKLPMDRIKPAPGLVVDTVPNGFTELFTLTVIESPYKAYQGPGGNVVYVFNSNLSSSIYNTITDKLALTSNFPPLPRVVQNKTDANGYFSAPDTTKDLTDAERADLAARAGSSIQFTPNGIKRLAITGVPAVIPGQLNAVLYDENPANRVYTEPRYSKVKLIETNSGWNKDLPVSPLNPPPNAD